MLVFSQFSFAASCDQLEAIRQQRLTDRQIHGALPRDSAFGSSYGKTDTARAGQNLRMLRERVRDTSAVGKFLYVSFM